MQRFAAEIQENSGLDQKVFSHIHRRMQMISCSFSLSLSVSCPIFPGCWYLGSQPVDFADCFCIFFLFKNLLGSDSVKPVPLLNVIIHD